MQVTPPRVQQHCFCCCFFARAFTAYVAPPQSSPIWRNTPLNKSSARGSTVWPTSHLCNARTSSLPFPRTSQRPEKTVPCRFTFWPQTTTTVCCHQITQPEQSAGTTGGALRFACLATRLAFLQSADAQARAMLKWENLAAGKLSHCWRGLGWGQGALAGLEIERNSENFFRSCTKSFQCQASLYQACDWNLAATKVK